MLLTFCSKLVIITVVPVLVQCVLPKLPQQCFISSSITTRNFEAKTFTEVTSARFFLIHADNFTIQFYNKILALIHQETAAGKTQAKSDQQINNCSDAKLWQLKRYWLSQKMFDVSSSLVHARLLTLAKVLNSLCDWFLQCGFKFRNRSRLFL